MRPEEEHLTKLALVANTAIQDIQVLTENEPLLKEEVNSMITAARGTVLAFRNKIEDVEKNAKLADKETDRLAIESLARNQRSELSRLNTTLRRVNLVTLTMLEKQEKSALMNSSEPSTSLKRRVKDKESAAKASGSITDSLMKTSQMMTEHLQRSNDTIETLANSSKGITSTSDELKSMQGHIKTARSLLTKYARKEMTHKLFIFLAVVFFLATVLYIMKKRLWSTGVTQYSLPQEHSNEPVLV